MYMDIESQEIRNKELLKKKIMKNYTGYVIKYVYVLVGVYY